MSRINKTRKRELSFFLNERNRITYNELCRKCIYLCKQSFRAIVLECRRFRSKRARGGIDHAVSE